jgi:hypothetical protein
MGFVELVSTIEPFSNRARFAARGARLVTSICSTWSARNCMAGRSAWFVAMLPARRFACPWTCIPGALLEGSVTSTSKVPLFAVTVEGGAPADRPVPMGTERESPSPTI